MEDPLEGLESVLNFFGLDLLDPEGEKVRSGRVGSGRVGYPRNFDIGSCAPLHLIRVEVGLGRYKRVPYLSSGTVRLRRLSLWAHLKQGGNDCNLASKVAGVVRCLYVRNRRVRGRQAWIPTIDQGCVQFFWRQPPSSVPSGGMPVERACCSVRRGRR